MAAAQDGAKVEWFGLPVDRAGMLRRECASCHRTFKVKAGEQDAAAWSRALLRKIHGANDAELAHGIEERVCPYCGVRAPEDGWFTAEQRQHLEKRAEHWQREVRYVQLSHPRRTLSANPYVTFLAVPPEPFAERAPEQTDTFRAFPLVCCRETIRVLRSWQGAIRCHLCGTRHEVQRTLPGFLERLEWAGVDVP